MSDHSEPVSQVKAFHRKTLGFFWKALQCEMIYLKTDFSLLPKSWMIHCSSCCSTLSSQIKWETTEDFTKGMALRALGREGGWEPKRGLSAIKRSGMRFTKAVAVGVEILARTSQTFDPTFSSRPRRLFCFKNYFYFYVLYILPTRNWLCLLPEKRCTVQLCTHFTDLSSFK